MFNVLQLLEKLQAFLEQGGALLVVIMTATFFLWLLILERHYYFLAVHKRVAKRIAGQWRARRDKSSWYARMIRLQLLSIARIRTEHNLGRIRLIVVIAPLLGLLGTITGMIDVFDVMASSGSGNARGMAAGVSNGDCWRNQPVCGAIYNVLRTTEPMTAQATAAANRGDSLSSGSEAGLCPFQYRTAVSARAARVNKGARFCIGVPV